MSTTENARLPESFKLPICLEFEPFQKVFENRLKERKKSLQQLRCYLCMGFE